MRYVEPSAARRHLGLFVSPAPIVAPLSAAWRRAMVDSVHLDVMEMQIVLFTGSALRICKHVWRVSVAGMCRMEPSLKAVDWAGLISFQGPVCP